MTLKIISHIWCKFSFFEIDGSSACKIEDSLAWLMYASSSLIVVIFNEVYRVVGVEGTILNRFKGFVVRKANLSHIDYTD